MNDNELRELISANSNPELAKEFGMVYQVWEDGEITLQKSGDLLWQRNLHSIYLGDTSASIPIEWFPHTVRNHGYIFTDKLGAEAVRNAILERNSNQRNTEFQ